MKAIRYAIPVVAVALLVVGLAGRYGQFAGLPIPQVRKPVTAAVIFYETKTKRSLPDNVKAVIDTIAPKHKIKTLDFDVRGPGGKTTPDILVPFLKACVDRVHPQLITCRGEDSYSSQPCPNSEEKLVEAIK
ncbi:MAG: hypothetical protein WC485_00170 [Opitutaceae bacterium]